MVEKRRENRLPYRQMIVLEYGPEIQPAFIQDLSPHGLGIRSVQRLFLYQNVRISLPVGQQTLQLNGEVRWIKEDAGFFANLPKDVGIFITNPPAEYLHFVDECIDHS